jgi:hypothetical protein
MYILSFDLFLRFSRGPVFCSELRLINFILMLGYGNLSMTILS